MVSIFVGSGAGFARGSGGTLGGAGILGSGVQGRGGETVSVNAATGNLLISQQDEFLVGRGPDAATQRTYNSLAEMSDGDNGDQWQFSTMRRVFGLTGTLNAAGSMVRRQGGDGSVVVYNWDVGQSAYVTTEGDGAHDRLVKSGTTWVWTDGSSRVTETYEASVGDAAVFRLKILTDTDGNALTYLYAVGTDKLETVATANHNNLNPVTGNPEVSYVYYSWSGGNIVQIITSYTDYGSASTEADNVNKQLTRTRYAYDAQNRLIRVTVDLTPTDNSIVDGQTYVTTYTYDGSSKRVASIIQTDGSSLVITYDGSGRVATLTQAVAAGDARVTTFGYGPNFTDVTGPDGQTTRLEYTGGNLASPTLPDWIADGLSWEAAGSVGGEAAIKFTSTPGATSSAISVGQAQAGDTFKFTASLLAVSGSAMAQTLGLYGYSSAWGSGGSTARIISGPGQLVHGGGGRWTVTGLSTTEATRIEVTRTYTQAENISAYLYVDAPGGFRDGEQLIVAGATLVKGDGDTIAPKQLSRIIAPPASAGAPRQVMEFFYSPNGDLIETRTGTLSENLLDLGGWAGERRGPNLLDLSGWPINPDSLPGGSATLAGWGNPGSTVGEARWVKTIGPNGGPVAVIQTGQTDGLEQGGGNYSHGFAIDKTKAYEFTTYFQVTELDKHRLYFGLSGNNGVLNAADGSANDNPYFAAPLPTAGSNYQAGRWYKIVGYVLPAGSGNVHAAVDLGGIYDVETGERVDDVLNYRWAHTQPADAESGVRFFNFYNESISGYYTNSYRPEIHEINLSGNAATIGGWNNSHAEETRWASAIGPDGKQAFVIEAGQTNATIDGGGNHSSYVNIDRSKAYEFTYYFQFTDAGKHSIYFGVQGPQAVEQLLDGVQDNNPYFFAIGPDQQPANFVEGRWYKVVGYVLPSGATAIPVDQLGGVYDVTTGEKILDLSNNFRWSSAGSDARIGVRFFNFYYENNLQYSTYFGKPEIREAAHRAATPAGYAGYTAETITDRKTFKYDTRGNVIETRDVTGAIVTRTYGTKNELLTETRTGSDASGAAVNHTTHYVYDSENHLRYQISAEGRVTQYTYHASGELYTVTEYPEHGYLVGSTPPTEAAMDAWHAAIADKQSLQHSSMVYDARGNMTQKVSYGSMTSGGVGWTSEGYTHSFWTYDHTGRMLNRHTASQNSETFVYDGLGRLVASTDMAGGTTTIVFNDTALTTTITTASGQTSIDSYNKAGDLVGTTQSSSYDLVATISYQYDKNGRVRVETDARGYKRYAIYDKAGRKVADIDHHGQVTEYRYDAAGRIASTATYANYLTAAQYALITDPNGTVEMNALRPADNTHDIWSWSIYDDVGRLIQGIAGDGSVATFTYDGSNRLVKTARYFNKLSANQLAGFRTVVPTALVLPPIDMRDTVSRSFYDRDGVLIGTLDGEGYLTEVIYDRAGQKVEEIAYATKGHYAYLADGTFDQLRATIVPTSIGNRRSHFVYDGQGLLRFSVDNAGYVTEYVYESEVEWGAIGHVRSTIRHAVAISTSDFTYDNVKMLVGVNASHAANRVSWSVYDAAGRLAYAIDADGAVTSFTYDVVGNVIKTVAFAAKFATSWLPNEATMNGWHDANIGNAANRITRNWYTARGDLYFTIDAEGYLERFDRDAEGRVLSHYRLGTSLLVGDGASAGDLYTLSVQPTSFVGRWYLYDAAGRMIQDRLVDEGLAGVTTIYSYDASGLLSSAYAAYGTSDQSVKYNAYDGAGRLVAEYSAYGEPEQAVVTYTYDGLGNRTSVTDARGKVTTFTYDERGQMLTATDAAGGVTAYEYNAFGEAVKTTDPKGGVTYTYYDELGRATKVRDAEDYVTETSYTVFGEIATVTRRYTKTASAVGTITPPTVTPHTQDATTRFEYDKRGLVIKTIDAEGWFESYAYDAFGNRTHVIGKSNGTSKIAGGTTYYAYDRRGLLVAETLPAPSADKDGNVLAYYTTNNFTYDARGNRTQKIEAAGLPEARTTNYVYDKADRLIETRRDVIRVVPSSGLNTVETRIDRISYDARGNVTSTTDALGGRTVYYYDDLDRAVATIDAVGAYSANIYDANGNITSTTTYDWGVSIPVNGGSEEQKPAAPGGPHRTTNFTYDNLGRLLTSTIVGANSYIFNGASYVPQTSNPQTTYEYDANGNVVKTTDPNGNASFAYYDKLGQKKAQVDAAGYVTSWWYDAEGNVIAERRFANRFTGTPSTSEIPSIATDSADRMAQYGYDLNGNRTSERREDVLVHDGAGGTIIAHPTVFYQYNGLGQVVRKTEATGEDIEYRYDSMGRLDVEIRSAFTSHQDTNVTPAIVYFYNGLGDLTRTVAAGAGDTGWRVTRYQYGTGGVLEWVQDSNGQTKYHYHDLKGAEIGTLVNNIRSNGTALESRTLTVRDALGRAVEARSYYYDSAAGAGWDLGDLYQTGYNAYGDVYWTALNSGVTKENRYYAEGRLVATTSGDGVWKHFGYDANGNQTIAITSAGTSLSGLTFDQALALVGDEGVNATYTMYDARGQAVSVTEEQRRLNGSTVQNLSSTRSYNAFGDVVSETNAAGATTTYSYNNIGRMIRSEGPTIQITLENGATQWVKPSQDHYYDKSGRLVATRDANGSYAGGGTSVNGTSKAANSGNLTQLTLLAGTGYGGSEALVTQQIAADGGIKQTRYDVHGNARTLIDEVGRTTTQQFDGLGRVTQVNHAGGLIDYYAYDGLGQRIRHWNNALGGGDVETTDYDTQGRVIKTRAFGGDITTTSYVWDASIAASGMGVITGGWTQVTTMANGRTATEKTDLFGRVTWKSDLGGHVTTYAYDLAGRQTSSTMGGLTASFTYYNTGQIATNSGPAGTATYGYDAAGNRISESLVNGGVTIKNASATYDALGRLRTWAEAGTAKSPAASTTHEYDAGGNIRRTQTSQGVLNATGGVASTQSKDYWFRYDSMNRLTVDKGMLVGAVGGVTTVIRARDEGTETSYNIAGERMTSRSKRQIWGYIGRPSNIPTEPGYLYYWEQRLGVSLETYTYDAAGRLAKVEEAASTIWGDIDTGIYVSEPVGPGKLRSELGYDLMGRLTLQKDYGGDEATGPSPFNGVSYSRELAYNAKGQVASDDVSTLRSRPSAGGSGYDTFRSVTTYDYGWGANYALGSVVSQSATNSKILAGSGGAWTSDPSTLTTTSYAWYDGAVQDLVTHDTNTGSGGSVYTTDLQLNGFGQLTGADVNDGVAKDVFYTLDEAGQIIRRDESRSGTPTEAAPHEVFYRFAGRQMGMMGNNGTSDISYTTSVLDRSKYRTDPTSSTAGLFRNGTKTGTVAYADFTQSHDPYNSYGQGSAGGAYTVRAGDTLQGIAQELWGDANLWYKLAEANGIGANNALIEGQVLTLPTGVMRSGHSASSMRPYDPTDAIGDLSPTTPKPPKKPKCGMLGIILVAAIAIGVAALLGPQMIAAFSSTVTTTAAGVGIGALGALSGGAVTMTSISAAGAIAAGAITGAVASAVSQGIGVATGAQDRFSWKGVGLAALSGGISGGVSTGGLFGGGGVANAIGRGAASNALTQGIGVATGLQSKFDFAGVAAAGAGAAAGYGMRTAFDGRWSNMGVNLDVPLSSAERLTQGAISNAATAIAAAATRSALSGGSFGDNLMRALPDVIGNALYESVVTSLAGLTSAKARHVQSAQLMMDGMQPIAGDADVDPAIVVTGRRMSLLEKLKFDIGASYDDLKSSFIGLYRESSIVQAITPLQLISGANAVDYVLSGQIGEDARKLSADWSGRVRGWRQDYARVSGRLYQGAPDFLKPAIGKTDIIVGAGFSIGNLLAAAPGMIANPFDTVGDTVGTIIAIPAALIDAGLVENSRGGRMVNSALASFNAMSGTEKRMLGGEVVMSIAGPAITVKTASVGRVGLAAETAIPAASRDLVPLATKSLGEWGEARLANYLGGLGVKPGGAFKTPLGLRYADRVLDGISYESKAGLNVKLTSAINRQIAKDAYLVKTGQIRGAEWHFWRGAQPEVVQALQNAGIKSVVH